MLICTPQTEAIRPPRHDHRKRRCKCGRWARYVSHHPHSNQRIRANDEHTLCFQCHRGFKNRFHARRLARRHRPIVN